MEFLRDIWMFLRERRKFWLAPIIVVLLLMGLLIALGAGTPLGPFIYAIF